MMKAQPGDYLLVETDHFVSKLIRFGQRSYGPEYARWNHVALCIGDGKIVEALTSGVVQSPLAKYRPEKICLVFTKGTELEREHAVEFAESCVGEHYGWLTIAAIALKVLCKGRLNFGVQGTSICSGLVARSLERQGYNWNPYEPAELTPAYLARKGLTYGLSMLSGSMIT